MTIRVLVVEDEPLIADAHREYTERVAGFSVVGVAHSARDALAVLRAEPVDLVLLDLNCRTGTAWRCAGRCGRRGAPPTCWR